LKRGVVIAFFGIPGVGKSTLARRFAADIGASSFLEPEESQWAEAVHSRDVCGHATAIQWFRATRVPHLFEAQHLKYKGKIVVVDSYYDKLCYYYLGKPKMEWLISRNDPYFKNIRDLAKLDLNLLPDADILVYISAPEKDWKRMLKRRNRNLDHKVKLQDTYATHWLFQSAVRKYAGQKRKVRLIEFENRFGNVEKSVASLRALINLSRA
jgi:thymidylate kinase